MAEMQGRVERMLRALCLAGSVTAAGYVAYKLAFSRENLGFSSYGALINLLGVLVAALDAALLAVLLWRRVPLRPLGSWRALRWLVQGVVLAATGAVLLDVPLASPEPHLLRLLVLIVVGIALVLATAPALRPFVQAARRRWIFRALGVVIGNVCFLLLALEIACRVVDAVHANPFTEATARRADARIAAYRLAPGSYWAGYPVNSLGFVDREFAIEKPSDTFRIAALGDSFAVGIVPHPKNFLTRLESELDAPGRRVEVLNFGVVGISPLEYAEMLRSEALRFHPDLVLVCFFAGNDFLEVSRRAVGLREHFASARFLDRMSRLVAEWLRTRRPSTEPALASGPLLEDTAHPFSEAAFLDLESLRLELCRVPTSERDQERYRLAFAALDDIVALARHRVAIAVIPDEFQVRQDLLERTLEHSRLRPEDVDPLLPQKRLARWAEERGVPLIDLLPPLRQAQQRGLITYKPLDTHWNMLGNEIAARAIADGLRHVIARLRDEPPR